ncbi:MFS transporter [Thermodesulfovibrionales bacterium]|nr:MFS transporter [Thermodesulfovibrionales bacterium]MCL0105933.1 MFS transporter [Thermodesulfovibrionales bacterium]
MGKAVSKSLKLPTFPQQLFYGYVVVGAAFFILLVAFGTLYSFSLFLRPMVAEFGWTRAMISGAYSLCMLLSGLLAVVMGSLTDRFGPRIVVAVCGLFLGIGYLLMSQINAIWQLYLFYGVIAIGMSGSFVPVLSTVARWFVKKRGMMAGIVVSGIGIGTVIMPLIVSRLAFAYGWRISYIFMGTMALVFVVLAAQFLRRDPAQMGQLPHGESEMKVDVLNLGAGEFSLREAILTREFWLLCAMLLCFGFYLQVIIVHIVPHAIDLKISAANAASILAIIGGISIAGRITMGGVADGIGNKPALIICLIIISVTLFWLMAAIELWMLYLFAVTFGFAYGGLAALILPIVAELFGLSSLGKIMGAFIFSIAIGEAIGPVLAGSIFDVVGSYQIAFLVCAIAGVISIALISLLRPTISGVRDEDF